MSQKSKEYQNLTPCTLICVSRIAKITRLKDEGLGPGSRKSIRWAIRTSLLRYLFSHNTLSRSSIGSSESKFQTAQTGRSKNSGVMVHSQSAESMARNQNFPISTEIQFFGGAGRRNRPTANLATPGTHVVMNDTLVTTHKIRSSSATYQGNEWVQVGPCVRRPAGTALGQWGEGLRTACAIC